MAHVFACVYSLEVIVQSETYCSKVTSIVIDTSTSKCLGCLETFEFSTRSLKRDHVADGFCPLINLAFPKNYETS